MYKHKNGLRLGTNKRNVPKGRKPYTARAPSNIISSIPKEKR